MSVKTTELMEEDEDDPYLWLENLENKKVVSWAIQRDRAFRRKLKPKLPKLSKAITKFYNARTILQVKVTKRGTFFLERRPKGYIIRLGKKVIANSGDLGNDYLIFEFYTDEAGDRLAYFISKGEDTGLLRIIEVQTGKLISELEGDVGAVTFLGNRDDDDYYYVKFFKRESTPDGVKPPTSRVMKGNKLVFGKGVPSGDFVSLEDSNGFALVTIGTWSRSEIFAGTLDKPHNWSKVFGARNFLSRSVG